MDALCRLRGRLGKNIPNSPTDVARMLHACPKDRPHITHAILTLVAQGFLILSNQQIDRVDRDVDVDRDEKKMEKKQTPVGDQPTIPGIEGPKLMKEPKPAPALLMPDWLPIPEWDAFVQMRKQIKKPLTDHAIKDAIGRLAKFRAAGQDVKAILNNSIFNNWQGLFEIKPEHRNGNGGYRGKESQFERTQREIAEGEKRLDERFDLAPQVN
jgi:hypothetical protein